MIVLYADAEKIPVLSDETTAKLQASWRNNQKEFAALSSKSRLQFVPDSGHNIHIEYPQIVIDAVREVFKQVTTS